MNVQKFEAESISAALAAVKRELGPDAEILRTRTVRRGWSVTGRMSRVELTARGPGTIAPRPHSTNGTDSPPAQFAGGIETEVREIRRMVHHVMRTHVSKRCTDLPESLTGVYLELLEQEIAEELAQEIVDEVSPQIGSDCDADSVRRIVLEKVATLIPVPADGHELIANATGPRTIALIGPTGVGKTTTVAKLAAMYQLRQSKCVGLVTFDTYRIAAVDQLRTYAQILGIPLHVAMTPADVGQAMRRCESCDVVVIDTAGRSPRDVSRLGELREMLLAAQPDETHLVLSSSTGERTAMDAVERFRTVGFNRVIFSKLDEAVSFGMLLNVARKVDTRLSYLTTGQEVPHRIEPCDGRRLAGLIMGEAL